ncbi:flagellin Hag [Clostridium bowmanii]|uniref:flagellin Hag n=1 Tax=Clostridium bowmanii TaxID=132925 RepID=UPI001C0DF3A1|nr:flagellin Hag [Clostridium bowmanii]MBU3190703.1 flagellin Hag [Clostridium bowmanii]MCA1075051.1 flagellin Hag [Clostridium bowmanii]
MIINHNLAAMNANRNMNINSGAAGKSMQKLSSGLRINAAGDDAAGLAISEKMRGQIRGLDQASSNAQDGISMVQTAEGALNETTAILQRMRELAVQAGTDTNTTEDRGAIQKEVNALTSEINRIGNTTEFNTQKLINGNKTGTAVTTGVITDGAATLQIGANSNQQFTVDIGDMRSKSLKLSGTTAATGGFAAAGATGASNALSDLSASGVSEYALDVTTASLATVAITTISTAITTVSSERAKLGAYTNRLEHTIANLGTTSENMTSAESRIRDVDMAKEMSTFSKNNILSQAAQAMLAQANQQPQQVLQLLR